MTARLGRVGAVAALGAVLTGGVVLAASRGGDTPAQRSIDSWASLKPSPLERTEVGAARIDDRIYVVGGFISSGGTTGRMARYDISEDSWKRVRSLPIAVNHPGMTVHRGRLYLLGGNLPGGEKSDRLYRYQPRRDRWRRLEDAPTARAAMGFVAIGNRLYAAGGSTASNDQVRRLEIYDVRRDRWTTGAKMPTGRNHVGATRLKRSMVVTGGRPGPVHGGLTSVESYDPDRNRWRALPPLGSARSGHAAVEVGGDRGGRIVVFGGEELDGGATIEQVEVFDPRVGEWAPLPEMVTPRHGLGGAAKGARVYALEGGPQPGLSYSRSLEFVDLP